MSLLSTNKHKFLISIIVISALILIGAGAGLVAMTRPQAVGLVKPGLGTPSAALLTPVASLEDLAAQYPQIGHLLRDDALGSVYKEFVLAYQTGGITAARALAEERALLDEHDQVHITLVIDAPANTPGVVAELQRMGIRIEGAFEDLIDIAVPLSLIEQFAQQDNAGKMFEHLTQLDHIVKLRLPLPAQTDHDDALENLRTFGAAALSEAVEKTGAAAWQRAGFDGQGVKIGILDLGFDGYKALLGKELPAQVTARSFVPDEEPDASGEVHGAACAEIVHALAPGAELFLAYYAGTEAGLGLATDWLLSQDVDIISHSAGSSVGPMDGSGRQARTVDDVTARGVLWVNASGNEAEEHYRGIFRDSDNDGLHEFPDGTSAMAYRPPQQGGVTIILNWSDWQQVDQDFDLFLVDSKGDIMASSQDSQGGQPGDMPVEGFRLRSLAQDSYFILIKADGATRPVTFDLFALNGVIEFPSAPYSLSTPADAISALSVGAVRWDTDELEGFSSQGPTNDERLKPELAAPDRVSTQSYAPDDFPGTSAAAPHVAGAAALVLSAFPNFSPDEVRSYLTSHALDLQPAGADAATGYGRLALPAPPGASGATAIPATTVPPPTALVRATVTPLAAAPIAPPAPRPRQTSRALIVALGAAVCLSFVGLIGGIVLLVVLLRRPPAAARPRAPAPPAAEVARIYLVNAAGLRLALHLGDNPVGRNPDNFVVLADDSQVSRHHARIVWDGRRLTISDLDSSNGTFVEGQRLAPHTPTPLTPGAHIRFGPHAEFIVRI